MLRKKQKVGKYRITGRISSGPLADVYSAYDTIHAIKVALKIPTSTSGITQEDYLHEVQVATKLQHPNILSVLNASYIDDMFVIAMELGEESMADRIVRRISISGALDLADQALAALAFAHENKIIHCDVKPENFILFPGNRLKLGDFGFAKLSLRTLKASGSGTIDYIAPEQAMGRPMFQSDVFSVGLVLYRLLSGVLPEWPYRWPMEGLDRLKSRVKPEIVAILKRAIQLDPAYRYKNAMQMYAAFKKADSKARRQRRSAGKNGRKGSSWRNIQWKEFQRQFRAVLQTNDHCRRCGGPVGESMQYCPWCGTDNPTRDSISSMPAHCPRCERGVKLDWDYCAWCYGPGFEAETNRHYPDKRYTAQCENKKCREPLMPFMKYCPWCRSKVRKPWKLEGSKHRCKSCKWGIAHEFWDFCAWCREPVKRS